MTFLVWESNVYYRALKLVRQYHRLTQTEVAAALGYSKSFISEIESNNKKPSIEVLEKYAQHFKIPLSSLMIFAENADAAQNAKGYKNIIADKALSMLEWLENSRP